MNNCFKIAIIASALTFAFFSSATASETPPPKDADRAAAMKNAREAFMANKVAFFTNELELTPEEAQVFWPLYNEFWDKRTSAHKDYMNILKRINSLDEGSKENVEKLSDEFERAITKESDLLKEYYPKFKKVLPTEKAMKIFNTEEKFKRSLFNRYKKSGAPAAPGNGKPDNGKIKN
ncbi:MAG: hypothetical protein IAC68_05580 [Bacteroidetes bacterium]|uniref:Uncharacterized protein n=1 Tax=Candidatus Egerieousia excrementavium TaxID=2840778 RepID=A0A9D9GW92_9BACT|nr:hypothetical protein [Candidatus Egerieousia excrementavium]